MRLIARRDGYHAYVTGILRGSIFPRPVMINFLIDTGCTTTTLLDDDVIRLLIDWNTLQEGESTETAHGPIMPRILENVELLLPVKIGPLNLFNSWIIFTSDIDDPMCIIPPIGEGPYTPRYPSHSLLGMDVLTNFKTWRFRGNNLFLDE